MARLSGLYRCVPGIWSQARNDLSSRRGTLDCARGSGHDEVVARSYPRYSAVSQWLRLGTPANPAARALVVV